MWRFFSRFMRSITKTWQMHFVGRVFDTATEAVLLAAAAYAATSGLPFYAALTLPLLFSDGVTFFGMLDGCFMSFAYGWALVKPVRKVHHSLVITGLSIAAAFFIGTVEMLGVLTANCTWAAGSGTGTSSRTSTSAGPASSSPSCSRRPGSLHYWCLVWRYGRTESRWSSPEAAPSVLR
jgi:high-affinity nickel-transport protein